MPVVHVRSLPPVHHVFNVFVGGSEGANEDILSLRAFSRTDKDGLGMLKHFFFFFRRYEVDRRRGNHVGSRGVPVDIGERNGTYRRRRLPQ